MLANHDLNRVATTPVGDDSGRRTAPRPRRAKGAELIFLTVAAAYALNTVDEWRRQGGTRSKKLAAAVLAHFAMLGVSFDPSGRPLLPGIPLDTGDIKRLHGRAAQASYVAVTEAVTTVKKACKLNDVDFNDLDISAFFDAFNEGAYAGESVRLGGRTVKREVHALDCATGECLGRQGF